MNGGKYVPVKLRTRDEIVAALSSGRPLEVRDALISAAYWEDDWKWAQERLSNFAAYNDDLVLWAVATGLGFIAAFHGEIDEDVALPILKRLRSSPNAAVVSAAEEAEADIDHFVKRRRAGEDISLGERLPEDWRPPSGHFPHE